MKLIPLSRGLSAIVDDEDYDLLNKRHWYAHRDRRLWYAWTKIPLTDGRQLTATMHRILLSPSPDTIVDHINRDGLDNRRANLRIASPSQNAANGPPRNGRRYRGTVKQGIKWRAEICVLYKHCRLGTFDTEEQAARAYDDAAKKFFGEFAYLNFPKEPGVQG